MFNLKYNVMLTIEQIKQNQEKGLFIQEICDNCFSFLETGESNHTNNEMTILLDTLTEWEQNDYKPIAPAYDADNNLSHFFSNHKCHLCNALPGMRNEYYFKSNDPDWWK